MKIEDVVIHTNQGPTPNPSKNISTNSALLNFTLLLFYKFK